MQLFVAGKKRLAFLYITCSIVTTINVSWSLIHLLIWDYSELHVFRGHQATKPGFIMGHEFTGSVVETGSAVKTVQKGDTIVSPFTTSWYEEPCSERG
jgi:hypothetical protein